MDVRLQALGVWAAARVSNEEAPIPPSAFTPVSDDASFRRYFRCGVIKKPMVFMDAPPEKEPLARFLAVTAQLREAAQPVPEVFAVDEQQGYLALSDFGDQRLFDALRTGIMAPTAVLPRVIKQLGLLARVEGALPDYSKALLEAELDLFPRWYLEQLLKIRLDDAFWTLWRDLGEVLTESAARQPQVFVHRDFHSRNIMMRPEGGLGLLDYQDAVLGPLTYDLVSLLKDCYWRFDRPLVVYHVSAYFEAWHWHPDLQGSSFEDFLCAFDLMGLQRHLKCAGIFTRLALRDGKAGYLDNIPLVMDYIFEVCREQPECAKLLEWLAQNVEPLIESSTP